MAKSKVNPIQVQVTAALECLREKASMLFDGKKLLGLNCQTVVTRPVSHLVWVDAIFDEERRSLVIKIPQSAAYGDSAKEDKGRNRLEKEFRNARFLAEKFKEHPELGIVNIIAYFSGVPALVMDEVQGNTIYGLLTRNGQWVPRPSAIQELESTCFAVGKWLKTFQGLTAQPDQQMSLDQMIEYVNIRLKMLTVYGIRGVDQHWRLRILEVFERSRGRINDSELTVTGVHGDFSPSNVLYSGKRIVVIDCSAFQKGSIYYDLTRFYHQLGLFLRKPSFRTTVVSRFRKALLRGYDPNINECSALFKLFTIQHVVCHWLGRLKISEGRFYKHTYKQWVCYNHKRELENLLAGGNGDVS